MKRELSYFERFIALNFPELRRFAIDGPAAVFGNSIDELSDILSKENKKEFNNKIKDLKTQEELNQSLTKFSFSYFLKKDFWRDYSYQSSDKSRYPNATKEAITDVELYKSACILFDLFSGNNLGTDCTFDYILEIALGYRYPDELVSKGATTSMQDNVFTLLFNYAGLDINKLKANSPGKNVKFETKKDAFLDEICQNAGFKRNLKSLIQFLQIVRNNSEHENITPELRYEQVRMWIYSYIYIIYVIRRCYEAKGEYKDISKKHWLTLFLSDNVSVFESPNAKEAVKCSLDPTSGKEYVKLLPFLTYWYNTKKNSAKEEFHIDNFCQYGELHPPVNSSNYRVLFEHSVLNSCTGVDDDSNTLKEDLLSGIRQLFDAQNKEWEQRYGSGDAASSQVVAEAVEKINNQTRLLVPLINANNEDLKALKIQVAQLSNAISELGFEDFKNEIAKRIWMEPIGTDWFKPYAEKLEEIQKISEEGHNTSHEKIDQLRKELKDELAADREQRSTEIEQARKENQEILSELKKAKTERRIFAWIRGVVALIALVIVGGFFYLRYGDNIPEVLYRWADSCGNKDAAYNQAVLLEKEKQYQESADWYLKARDKYAKLLVENPDDSIRSSRMAEMAMRGKGGIINTDTAEHYAHMAKRYDLEALLALLNGNVYKSRDIINNFRGEKTPYLNLADAYGSLVYSKSSLKLEDFNRNWEIIDSLASTFNMANQEALVIATQICDAGVYDINGTLVMSPSLYDAIAYAQDADEHYNSLASQLYLATKCESLHLKEAAEKYNAKAKANNRLGQGEITFSHDRILELSDDPQALAAKAHNNLASGYTDYRMTAYYYHLADSINKKKNLYRTGSTVYQDWLNFIVRAEDLSTFDQILPLVNKDYPDSIREAIANYVMAMKYSNGYGVPIDASKSGDYMLLAANGGLNDAAVSVGISWDLDSISDGMKILKRMTSGKGDSIHPHAARYILSKSLKQNVVDVDLINRMNNDEFGLLIMLNEFMSSNVIGSLERSKLYSLRQKINLILSEKTDYTNCGFLLGKLAEVEYALDHRNEALFYIESANNISPKSCYTSLWGISEMARKKGDLETAAYYAGGFAKLFFMNNGEVRYEPERINVINHFYTLYPDIFDSVKEETGYDFLDNEYLMEEVGFDLENDFSKYVSPVGKLKIELPDYAKFTFPVTMKYFD